VPDRRTHRGPDPEDARLFGERELPKLAEAARDLVWLLDRGYAHRSALELVGDRHGLRARQRLAVARSVCTGAALAGRRERELRLDAVAGEEVVVDGFNLLTTVEGALGGAIVLRGRDGCYRDVSGVHGGYRRVAETAPAIAAVGALLALHPPSHALWLLDRPVSNSGKLAAAIREIAAAHGWPWTVELPFAPDRLLRESSAIVATADGPVLDAAARWTSLARHVVVRRVPTACVVDLSG
jgi:hypothetical protein